MNPEITLFILLIAAIILVARIVFAKMEWLSIIDKSRETSGGYLDVESTETIKVPEKINNPKKLEAVTVCVGYADFLSWTLPFNKAQFDRLIVITTPDDEETQAICEYWHVECIKTNAFYEGGDSFNKGRGINEGLKLLDKTSWVLHFDADIFLLPRTREILNLLPLDPQSVYSIDRLNCKSFGDFARYISNPERHHGNNGMMGMNAFEKGARLLNLDRDGYVPIGYFQLWNPIASGVLSYPIEHGTADRSDTLFAYNWLREKRHIIPELICVHLESEACQMGANWQGRKTRAFAPEGI
jgi:hypothetical protein